MFKKIGDFIENRDDETLLIWLGVVAVLICEIGGVF